MLLEAFEDGDVVMDVNKEAGDIGIDEEGTEEGRRRVIVNLQPS